MVRGLSSRGKDRIVDDLVMALVSSTGDDSDEFVERVRQHLRNMPSRYAKDMQLDRAEDILIHMQLIRDVAGNDGTSPAFHVREITDPLGDSACHEGPPFDSPPAGGHFLGQEDPDANVSPMSTSATRGSLGRATFGSYHNLHQLAHQGYGGGGLGGVGGGGSAQSLEVQPPLYEVTFADRDRPKRLHLMSRCLAESGLDVREAHAFVTSDRFLLNVFIVDVADEAGHLDSMAAVITAVRAEIAKVDWIANRVRHEAQQQQVEHERGEPRGQYAPARPHVDYVGGGGGGPGGAVNGGLSQVMAMEAGHGRLPRDPVTGVEATPYQHPPSDSDVSEGDHLEIDGAQLERGELVESGTFGALYRGAYRGREVAIKYLKTLELTDDKLTEFHMEVAIMKQLDHRNVLRLIGARTQPPELCIVTDFMQGGSVTNFRKQPQFLKSFPVGIFLGMCLDIARGMVYLHQHSIVHRDLKGANLLVADDGSVKVADFGVARVIDKQGTMTAETGTYRWMAPEVISHRPYTTSADVYSFGIVMWELWTSRIPYQELTPMQAAVGVVQRSIRPPVPPSMPKEVAALMKACWIDDPAARPSFAKVEEEIVRLVEHYHSLEKKKKSIFTGFLSRIGSRGAEPVAVPVAVPVANGAAAGAGQQSGDIHAVGSPPAVVRAA